MQIAPGRRHTGVSERGLRAAGRGAAIEACACRSPCAETPPETLPGPRRPSRLAGRHSDRALRPSARGTGAHRPPLSPAWRPDPRAAPPALSMGRLTAVPFPRSRLPPDHRPRVGLRHDALGQGVVDRRHLHGHADVEPQEPDLLRDGEEALSEAAASAFVEAPDRAAMSSRRSSSRTAPSGLPTCALTWQTRRS